MVCRSSCVRRFRASPCRLSMTREDRVGSICPFYAGGFMGASTTSKALTILASPTAQLGLLLFLAGCPQTSHPPGGNDSAADGSSSQPELVVPARDSQNIPRNLRRLVVASQGDPGPIQLMGPGEEWIPTEPATYGAQCEEMFCTEMALTSWLAPSTSYRLWVRGI